MGSIICYNLILEEMSCILVIRGSHGQLRPSLQKKIIQWCEDGTRGTIPTTDVPSTGYETLRNSELNEQFRFHLGREGFQAQCQMISCAILRFTFTPFLCCKYLWQALLVLLSVHHSILS